MATSPEDNGLSPMSILDHLNVRLAKPEDAGMIVSFSAAMALETENRRLDLDRLYEGTIALLEFPDRGFFIVAELEHTNRQLLGQLMITYEWSDWRNGAFWWIQSVYVDPAWRRKRVYRRLHDTIVAIGKVEYEDVRHQTVRGRDNRAAQTVYRRVGMAPSMYEVYEDDFVLRRQWSVVGWSNRSLAKGVLVLLFDPLLVSSCGLPPPLYRDASFLRATIDERFKTGGMWVD